MTFLSFFSRSMRHVYWVAAKSLRISPEFRSWSGRKEDNYRADGHSVCVRFEQGPERWEEPVIRPGQWYVRRVRAADRRRFKFPSEFHNRGHVYLSDEDFGNRLVSNLADEFQIEFKRDVRDNPWSPRRLRTSAERAERTLVVIVLTDYWPAHLFIFFE